MIRSRPRLKGSAGLSGYYEGVHSSLPFSLNGSVSYALGISSALLLALVSSLSLQETGAHARALPLSTARQAHHQLARGHTAEESRDGSQVQAGSVVT